MTLLWLEYKTLSSWCHFYYNPSGHATFVTTSKNRRNSIESRLDVDLMLEAYRNKIRKDRISSEYLFFRNAANSKKSYAMEYIFEHNCWLEACNYVQKCTPSCMIFQYFSKFLKNRSWDASEPKRMNGDDTAQLWTSIQDREVMLATRCYACVMKNLVLRINCSSKRKKFQENSEWWGSRLESAVPLLL